MLKTLADGFSIRAFEVMMSMKKVDVVEEGFPLIWLPSCLELGQIFLYFADGFGD